MAVILQKRQTVDLKKKEQGLKNVYIGLGWDSAKKGLLGVFKMDVDCDASVFMLQNNKLQSASDIIYYGHLVHSSGAVKHHGDDLVGGKKGDCERISIHLDSMPKQYNRLIIAVNIYKAFDRHQNFGKVHNAFIRIVDEATDEEFCRYNLSENHNGDTAVLFGELVLGDNGWAFTPLDEGCVVASIRELSNRW